jgi:Cd2+/Zn2+-exporting ATPase
VTRPLKQLPLVSAQRVPEASPEPEPTPGGRRFTIEGMDCAACARTVEKTVAGLEGVQNARVSFGTGVLVLDGAVDDAVVAREVARAGYRVRPAERGAGASRAPLWRRDRRALSTSASIPLLLVAVVASLLSAPRAVAEPLYLLSMAVGGWPIAMAALGALRRRLLDMNVLMTLAALGAVAIGAYAEGAWVLVLFAVGTALEAVALERTRGSMAALLDLAPVQARVIGDGNERAVPVADVRPGTDFVVRPGERVPLDGIVVSGSSSLDQAPITGESVPVDKEAGDNVFAGTMNTHGALVVRATKAAAESTLSRVASLVEEAQGSRAPSERFIDRFARIYTPFVFVAALLVAVTAPVAFGGEWSTWIYRALALLIVACPCSLVISVPVAVVSAVGGAARQGILIKGGQALEDLANVKAVAVDKTGTLTLGLPQLTSIATTGEVTEDEALRLMAAVEQRSEHPLAAAIGRAARERGIVQASVEEFVSLPGRGAAARVENRSLWAGGPRLIADRGAEVPPELEQMHLRGETAVALGEGDRVVAVFGLSDRARPEAADVAEALERIGIDRLVMLTGDTEAVARAVAARTGIREWRAGLLPEEKLAAVRALEAEVGAVAMVGDGVNDAPALAAARVGIAMGAAGSDVALQSADVALMSDRLDRIAVALRLSRRAMNVMRANVAASLIVKGAFVLLAPFGLVTLVVAVAADMGMSLLVTVNALRLLGRRPAQPAAPR